MFTLFWNLLSTGVKCDNWFRLLCSAPAIAAIRTTCDRNCSDCGFLPISDDNYDVIDSTFGRHKIYWYWNRFFILSRVEGFVNKLLIYEYEIKIKTVHLIPDDRLCGFQWKEKVQFPTISAIAPTNVRIRFQFQRMKDALPPNPPRSTFRPSPSPVTV